MRGHSLIRIAFDQFVITAEGDHVMYTLPVDHTVKMQVNYVDAKGNPASVDGDVSWESSDASIISVSVDPSDSTICTRCAGRQHWARCRSPRQCDADLGEGVRELITTCDIDGWGEAVAGSHPAARSSLNRRRGIADQQPIAAS